MKVDYQVHGIPSVQRVGLRDPDDENAEKGILIEGNLGRGLEAETAVFCRPAVESGVLVHARNEKQLVKARQVRVIRIGSVPLQGGVPDPGERVLLNLCSLEEIEQRRVLIE